MVYFGNAFSLQMVDFPVTINVEEVLPSEIPEDAISCIGHADTAAVVSGILGRSIPVNRTNIKLDKDDILYVAQLTGGRLPEGAKTLPDGFRLTFIKVSL